MNIDYVDKMSRKFKSLRKQILLLLRITLGQCQHNYYRVVYHIYIFLNNLKLLCHAYYSPNEIRENESSPEPELPPERKRKRDILKRTFGIFSKSSDDNASLSSSNKDQDESNDEGEGKLPDNNFLTVQDEERINATYASLKEEGMKKMMENFDSGEFANVTLEEATKIVEYAVQTEVRTIYDMYEQPISILYRCSTIKPPFYNTSSIHSLTRNDPNSMIYAVCKLYEHTPKKRKRKNNRDWPT